MTYGTFTGDLRKLTENDRFRLCTPYKPLVFIYLFGLD